LTDLTGNNLSNTDEKVDFSVVVPVYNSTDSLIELCQRLTTVFEETIKESFEIFLVDDASPNPDTWKTMEQLHEKDGRVKVIQLMHNAGQHNTIMCGLKYSTGDFIVTMDDDLQHPPEEIPNLIEALRHQPQYDAILGVPYHRKHATYRNIGSFFLNKILGLAIKKPKNITLSSFRLITKDLKEALLGYTGHVVTVGALICQTTRNIANVEVRHDPRRFGKSTYSLSRLFRLAVANIFNFSDFPLKVISFVGFIASLFSMLYALWIIYCKLIGSPIQAGFSTIVVLVSFFSGLILFSFGVMGQYLIRILKGVTGGSQFVVRKKGD
jgi:glycosyltransferase involved in cell wall biosynthesis